MANIQKYATFSLEDAESEEQELSKLGQGADFLKLKEGKNQLRFLPAKVGDKPFVRVQQHFIEPPGGKGFSFACPRIHAKKACPVCDRVDKLYATGNPRDEEEAKKLKPSLRVFANVIDRSDPERGVVVFGFGKTIYEQLIALRKDDSAGGDYMDPGPEGFDIVIERTGQGMKTEYKVWPARRTSPLGNDDWLEQMHSLARYAKVMTTEEIAAALGGQRESSRGAPREAKQPRGRSAADDTMDTDD
jgi:hypothetical protein